MGDLVETSFNGLIRPHGLTQIKEVLGDIDRFIMTGHDGRPVLDSEFEGAYLAVVQMPFALPVAGKPRTDGRGKPGECVNRFRCHILMALRFETIFNRIFDEDLEYLLMSFGGCFQFRRKRNGRGLSTHAWGVAIDLNPETNAPGTDGDMHEDIVRVFKEAGFI